VQACARAFDGPRRLHDLLQEDRLLRLTGEQALNWSLSIDSRSIRMMESRAAGSCARDPEVRSLVRLLDHPADLSSISRAIVRVVGLVAHLAAEERHALVAASTRGPSFSSQRMIIAFEVAVTFSRSFRRRSSPRGRAPPPRAAGVIARSSIGAERVVEGDPRSVAIEAERLAGRRS
jgi:hypothetical protein